MKNVICSIIPGNLPTPGNNDIPVLLYGSHNQAGSAASIGNSIIREVSRFLTKPTTTAFDFMTIALAVTAADTFVTRKDAADGWCREIRLVVPVSDPTPWHGLTSKFEDTLRFLTGDKWHFEFTDGGRKPPDLMKSKAANVRRTRIFRKNCVCLLSGGLDSAAGAAEIIADGKKPVLVSHAYPKDAEKQDSVAGNLTGDFVRVCLNANPVWSGKASETSMRSRSLNFIAFGALAASVVGRVNDIDVVELVIPENGLISINPPLTPRRVGSLSTRTTHPYFLSQLQAIMDQAGLNLKMVNPYKFKTKGELLTECPEKQFLKNTAASTVSCGRWKRSSQQCGRCVPCIVRRAAFHAWDFTDPTSYRQANLKRVLADEGNNDDLLSFAVACHRFRNNWKPQWVSQNGPLPNSDEDRDKYVDVVRRGLSEVADFLTSQGITI